MNKMTLMIILSFGLSLITGCQTTLVSTSNEVTEMQALYSSESVTVDGKLDDPVWSKAIQYEMYHPQDRLDNPDPFEGGRVQLAWDDAYFYVGIDFDDSDIYAEGKSDEMRHFELGDLCELFLKPDGNTWYWEHYVTPRGKKTSFFFPGCGRFGLPGCMDYTCGLKVAAEPQGTLEVWKDRDRSWTAEMAMPIQELTVDGVTFDPQTQWRILVARYNYSRFMTVRGPQYSTSPQISQTNFHLLPEYAYLKLVK